jgi:integration host factor subunit alpha
LISGFGKFSVKEKRELRRKNPMTGEDLWFGIRTVVTFGCSAALGEKINGKGCVLHNIFELESLVQE